MQISDEFVSLAINAARKHARDVMGVACEIEPETMRAALEAALGARRGDGTAIINGLADCSITLRKHGLGLAANLAADASDCIEELAGALNEMTKTQTEWEKSISQIIGRPIVPFERAIDRARATLERWGLK